MARPKHMVFNGWPTHMNRANHKERVMLVSKLRVWGLFLISAFWKLGLVKETFTNKSAGEDSKVGEVLDSHCSDEPTNSFVRV